MQSIFEVLELVCFLKLSTTSGRTSIELKQIELLYTDNVSDSIHPCLPDDVDKESAGAGTILLSGIWKNLLVTEALLHDWSRV